ncbi:MAG TPA: hypothetical protein VGU24_00070 [Microvirga sp.]|nr:hypothetical protein [Microvirga sp.]
MALALAAAAVVSLTGALVASILPALRRPTHPTLRGRHVRFEIEAGRAH